MIECHEREFMQRIEPELVRAFYRGRNKKEDEQYKNDFRTPAERREHFISYSRIFQATNTILPNLYYQNPRIIVSPSRGGDDSSSALMSSVLNHYMKELHQKEENQEAVLNTWFFGLGWKKIGYQTFFMPQTQDPESMIEPKSGIIDKFMGGVNSILGKKPDNLESKERPQLVDYETVFNNSESPLNIMLDYKADLKNCKVKLHRMKRTLYELKNFGDYDENEIKVISEKLSKQGGTRLDDREIDTTLNELHIQQRNGIWILTWIEEHNKPLKYDKSDVGDAFEPLVFTNEPGVRYPISHMKVATQIQEHLDYMATLMIRIIDKTRNQLIINEKDLAPGQTQAIERNKIGGVIKTNKPINQGTFAQLTSAGVQNDLPLLMGMVQQNITEILGTDEQIISGNSKNKTLGQDKIANLGTQIRESGMLDKVRDWMINQKRKEGELIKLYSNAELHLQITGKDFRDKMTGMPQEDKWVSFMTPENPLGLKHYLKGEFDYDINIYEAIKPDNKVMREQYMGLIELGISPDSREALLGDNKKLRVGKLFDKVIGTFDAIGDTSEFVEDLTPQQVAAIQTQEILKQSAGSMLQEKQRGRQAQAQQSMQKESPSNA